MPLDIIETSPIQDSTGQPIVEGTVPDASLNSPEMPIEGATPVATDVPAGTEPVTAVATEIAPEALRQITALSAGNRKLKAEIAALQAKVNAQAAITPEEVTAKLAQLASFEGETPRAYLKRTGKTLEDVAADVLVDDTELLDPRVDSINATLEEIKKQLADKAAATADEVAKQNAAAHAKMIEQSASYAKSILDASPARWELIAGEKDIATEVVKAAMIVAERDHKGKQLSKEQVDSIISDCFDQAETFKLAEKMVKERKNLDPSTTIPVLKKGIEVLDSSTYVPDRGGDGKGGEGAKPPKVTIDGNRGAVRQGAVKRGPTDVRTARARALRIAGAGSGDED